MSKDIQDEEQVHETDEEEETDDESIHEGLMYGLLSDFINNLSLSNVEKLLLQISLKEYWFGKVTNLPYSNDFSYFHRKIIAKGYGFLHRSGLMPNLIKIYVDGCIEGKI